MSAKHVQELARDAWWYAIGRKDAGESVDDFGFKAYYEELAAQYDSGDVFFRPSIRDAYNDYQKGTN